MCIKRPAVVICYPESVTEPSLYSFLCSESYPAQGLGDKSNFIELIFDSTLSSHNKREVLDTAPLYKEVILKAIK